MNTTILFACRKRQYFTAEVTVHFYTFLWSQFTSSQRLLFRTAAPNTIRNL